VPDPFDLDAEPVEPVPLTTEWDEVVTIGTADPDQATVPGDASLPGGLQGVGQNVAFAASDVRLWRKASTRKRRATAKKTKAAKVKIRPADLPITIRPRAKAAAIPAAKTA